MGAAQLKNVESRCILRTMNKNRQTKLIEALDTILDKLINDYQSEKIILFGSLVSDNVHEWSDIDLAIIKETPKPFIDRSVEAALLCLAPVGVDYLVYTPQEFLQLITDKNPFVVEEIVNRGKVLYERTAIPAMA
jgi:predicted nucleotidyltransferase